LETPAARCLVSILLSLRNRARNPVRPGKRVFMREALPEAPETTRALAADLITTTLSKVGKRFSESPRTRAEIEAYAEAMADVFCAYLEGLKRG
jgi:hypothetical protein